MWQNIKAFSLLIIYLMIMLAASVGWFMNVVKILSMTFGNAHFDWAVFIVRVLGMPFAPLGAIIGYF